MGFLSSVSTALLMPLLLVVLALSTEVGLWHGRRRGDTSDHHRQQTTMMQGALLGLLALFLGFSFSMAVERFEQRRQMLLDESNAIGTAHLRAQLLVEPRRGKLMELLFRYAEARLAFQHAGRDERAFLAADAAATALHPRLWDQIVGAERETAAPIVATVVQALNQVIDLEAVRLAAMYNHVPAPVIWVLVLIAVIACAFAGYGSGLGGRRNWSALLALPGLLGVVIVLIVDLDRPRHGLITVDARPLERLVEALGGQPRR